MWEPANLVITLSKILISCRQGVDRAQGSSGSNDDGGLGSDRVGSEPAEEADVHLSSSHAPTPRPWPWNLKWGTQATQVRAFSSVRFTPAPGLCPLSFPLSRDRARHLGHLDIAQNVSLVLYINGIMQGQSDGVGKKGPVGVRSWYRG